MPEPGSAAARFYRICSGATFIPFGALWVSLLGYELWQAARTPDICGLVALSGAALWFGFITYSALKYAFTGYYPVTFIRLWNVTWGWLAGRAPLPPPRKRKL